MKKINLRTRLFQAAQMLVLIALFVGGGFALNPPKIFASAPTPTTTSNGRNTPTDGRNSAGAESGPTSASTTLKNTLTAICHKQVSGSADAGCNNANNINHVYNIATQQCQDKSTISKWEACIKDAGKTFFTKADALNPKDAKTFTSQLSNKVLAGKGNPNKPSSKKPSISADIKCSKSSDFLGFKSWYHYLKLSKDGCDIQGFNLLPSDSEPSDVPLILLAIVDDLLRLAGLIAVGFVLFGGLKYIASQGNPEDTAKAQGTVLNALLGLAVSLVAVAFVAYLGSQLGG